MKKIILSFFLALASVTSFAQQRFQFSPDEMATRQANQLKEKCGISDEQYAAALKIYLDNAKEQIAERDSLRKNNERPRFDPEAMKAKQEKVNAAIKAILTEEQYSAYEQLLKERANRFRQGQRGGQGRQGERGNGARRRGNI